MAQQSTEQIIKDHLATLPEPVKKAIASFDWAKEVFDVGRKHIVHVDDIGEIQTEVMMVVLGLISPREFYDQMVSRIGIEEDLALEIADEINERVFMRIRDFMKNYYAEEEKKGKEIVSSERTVLRSAGISLGDEPDEPQIPVEPADDEEKFIILPTPEVVKKVVPTPAPVIPDIASKLQNSAVFKNKSSNYLDPYREPVE